MERMIHLWKLAQTLNVTDSRLVPFINCTQSIRIIDEMFQRREQREILKKSEPSRELHKPWVVLREGSPFRWGPSGRNTYDGHNSGGRHGPSNAMKRAALREHSLLDIFFFIFSVSVLKKYVNGRTFMLTRNL